MSSGYLIDKGEDEKHGITERKRGRKEQSIEDESEIVGEERDHGRRGLFVGMFISSPKVTSLCSAILIGGGSLSYVPPSSGK